MKKEVENKNSFITDLSSSESSGDESEKEIPIENKKEIEKYLLNSDDEKNNQIPPRKQKSLSRKDKILLTIVLIKIVVVIMFLPRQKSPFSPYKTPVISLSFLVPVITPVYFCQSLPPKNFISPNFHHRNNQKNDV